MDRLKLAAEQSRKSRTEAENESMSVAIEAKAQRESTRAQAFVDR